MKKIIYIMFCMPFFLSLQSGLSEAEEVTFRFAPKDKMVMLERVDAVNEEILDDKLIQEQKSLVSTKILYTRTEKGFELKAEITKIEFFINGEKTENPVFELLMECPIVYKIDSSGRLFEVNGYDKFNKILYENFTKEFADEISGIFNEQEMTEKAKFDWDQKIGNYVGKTVSDREKWTEKKELSIPGGQKTDVDVETVFILNQKIDGKDCIKIEISYMDSDKSGKNLKGKTDIFMDPATMEIYSMSTERTVGIEKENKLLREKREYYYEYIF
jgi:hypothetical protein